MFNLAKASPFFFTILITGMVSDYASAQAEPNETIDRIEHYSQEGRDSIEQVTNVNQLRDLSPTDWSYEAVKSLTERYWMRVPLRLSSTRGRIAAYLDFLTALSKVIARLLVMSLLRV